LHCLLWRHNADLLAVLINYSHLFGADAIVDADLRAALIAARPAKAAAWWAITATAA
jgi:hypothetical protein